MLTEATINGRAKRTRGFAACVMGLVLAMSMSNAYAGVDQLGGDSIHSQVNNYDANGSGTWEAKLSSFVYDSTSSFFPPGIPATPGPGETLFVYLVENVGDSVALSSLTVANDFPALPITDIGSAPDVTPSDLMVGATEATIANSSAVNPLSQVFTWQVGIIFDPDPIPTTDLLPDNYAIQYYIAESTWQLVNGTIESAAAPETQLVPGPLVPEPASLALLGLGALFVVRRKR